MGFSPPQGMKSQRKTIDSDRENIFVSLFWRALQPLYKVVGNNLRSKLEITPSNQGGVE